MHQKCEKLQKNWKNWKKNKQDFDHFVLWNNILGIILGGVLGAICINMVYDWLLAWEGQLKLVCIYNESMLSIYSDRHHPGCHWSFGGQNKLTRREYLCSENELAANFHVMWFISLFLLSLLIYTLIYTFSVVRDIMCLNTLTTNGEV